MVVKPRAYLDTPSAHIYPTFYIDLTIPTTAIRRGLSERRRKYAKGVFNGRGVPRPYQAVFYTALRNAFNIQSMPDARVCEMMKHRFAITLLLQE